MCIRQPVRYLGKSAHVWLSRAAEPTPLEPAPCTCTSVFEYYTYSVGVMGVSEATTVTHVRVQSPLRTSHRYTADCAPRKDYETPKIDHCRRTKPRDRGQGGLKLARQHRSRASAAADKQPRWESALVWTTSVPDHYRYARRHAVASSTHTRREDTHAAL